MKLMLKRSFALLAIGVGLAVNANAQSFLTNGLVAYFPFNGNASDASGNENNGTVNGATLTADRFGQTNQAYLFDGDSDYIQKSDVASLRMTNSLAISAWINPLGSTYAQMIVCKEEEYWIALIDGKLSCALANSDSTVFVLYLSTVQISTTQWSHVAMSFNSGSLSLYLNGSSITNFTASSQIGSVPVVAEHEFWIGGRQGTPVPYQWFNGLIDDVRIYNRALSASEVTMLYENESGLQVNLIKAIKPSFSGLYLGTNYQMQISSDMNSWTNYGLPFPATNTSMVYPQYWDVENWNSLFFRLKITP